jgi:type IV pilus assembly protein PilV
MNVMKNRIPHSNQVIHHQSGSMLLEALISVVIFSIALIGLIGIQGHSIKQNLQTKFRNDAGFIANRIMSDIHRDAANYLLYGDDVGTPLTYDADTSGSYAAGSPQRQWAENVAAVLPNGRVVVLSNAADASVTVTVSWVPTSETASVSAAGYRHQHVLVSRINVRDI